MASEFRRELATAMIGTLFLLVPTTGALADDASVTEIEERQVVTVQSPCYGQAPDDSYRYGTAADTLNGYLSDRASNPGHGDPGKLSAQSSKHAEQFFSGNTNVTFASADDPLYQLTRSTIQDSVINFEDGADMTDLDLYVKVRYDASSDEDKKAAKDMAMEDLKVWTSKIYISAFQAPGTDSTESGTVGGLFYILPKDHLITSGVEYKSEADGTYVEAHLIDIKHTYCTPDEVPCQKDEAKRFHKEYDEMVDKLVSHIPATARDADKVKMVHDWFIHNCEYDHDFNPVSYNAYSAMVTGKPVCRGFSLANQDVLARLGIESQYVNHFDGNGGHAWNKVLVDGEWYHEDITWDDMDTYPYRCPENFTCAYFLKSDAYMTQISQGDIHCDWNPRSPACTSTLYDDRGTWGWTMYWLTSDIGSLDINDGLSVSYNSRPMYNFGLRIPNIITDIKSNGIPLVEGRDYSIVHSNWWNAGISTLTIYGVGRTFSGKRQLNLNVQPLPISVWNFKPTSSPTYQAGIPLSSNVMLSPTLVPVGAVPPRQELDYTCSCTNNTEAGTGYIIVHGKGNYTGMLRVPFTIQRAPISSFYAEDKYSIRNVIYNGSPKKPIGRTGLSLAYWDGTAAYATNRIYYLTEGKDYTVTYRNNVNVGTATAIITGKGNCYGTVVRTFRINPVNASSMSISNVYNKVYNGCTQYQNPVVKVDNKVLRQGTDYTLSYANNKNVGTARMTINCRGNYAGSKTVTFYIDRNDSQKPHSVQYRTHVQNVGWQGWKSNGAQSGTTGRSLRLEGINIRLADHPYSGGIQYRTHIQNIGWERGWKYNGAQSGTTGRSLRLEAIQISLYGDMSKHYDVWYRVHCQNFGWMGWAKNGQSAGSAGYSYRLEGIQIKLLPKGSVPGSTANRFRQR